MVPPAPCSHNDEPDETSEASPTISNMASFPTPYGELYQTPLGSPGIEQPVPYNQLYPEVESLTSGMNSLNNNNNSIYRMVSSSPVKALNASQSPFDVAATLTVRNHTQWTLRMNGIFPYYGEIETPISYVGPGHAEIMEMHKTGGTTSGTSGTIGFNVEGQEKEVVIMWSVPYNHDHYSNWMGVGLFPTGSHDKHCFKDMYYAKEIGFQRKQFYSDTGPVIFTASDIRVSGCMGTSHKTNIIVDVMPAPVAAGKCAGGKKSKN